MSVARERAPPLERLPLNPWCRRALVDLGRTPDLSRLSPYSSPVSERAFTIAA
jgi:hypothetical protein